MFPPTTFGTDVVLCSEASIIDVLVKSGGLEAIELVVTGKPGAQGATVDWGKVFGQIFTRPDEQWMGSSVGRGMGERNSTQTQPTNLTILILPELWSSL
jgi:hypothetical protein